MEILELAQDKGFQFNPNPFSRPPLTVVELGNASALSWWRDVKRFGEGTSNKLKLVLVGLAEAGKTTVACHLMGRPVPKQLDRTVGLDIHVGWTPLEGLPLEVSVWDFAGQADYYASHQLFLSKGSLFLLVVDLSALYRDVTEEENTIDPHGRVHRWLEMLQLRVPGAAVALVGTHKDDIPLKSDDAKVAYAVGHLKTCELCLLLSSPR